MSLILDVKLDLTTNPPTALVEDLDVKPNTLSQTIMWRLVPENLAVKLTHLHWGDYGDSPDPANIFGRFLPAQKGQSATMKDTHTDVTTMGAWPYSLEVEYANRRHLCKTQTTGGSNPNIRNN